MSVPEATVDEDDGTVFRQYNVGSAGKSLDAFTEAVAAMPQFAPDSLLRAGVFRMYLGHTFVALLRCHMVRHIRL